MNIFNTSLFFFVHPDPWQQQHLAYALTSVPPPQAVCSQNLLEPQPDGTAAMVAAQSCASAVEAEEARKKRKIARTAARRKEREDFIFLFGWIFCFCF